mmetsp:Transcript_35815/g.93752  ORF Transcript_35815/g.93752 Transcript_35815/m.93752 type:complete len:265 (-) Transcript_35815:17-811(-)
MADGRNVLGHPRTVAKHHKRQSSLQPFGQQLFLERGPAPGGVLRARVDKVNPDVSQKQPQPLGPTPHGKVHDFDRWTILHLWNQYAAAFGASGQFLLRLLGRLADCIYPLRSLCLGGSLNGVRSHRRYHKKYVRANCFVPLGVADVVDGSQKDPALQRGRCPCALLREVCQRSLRQQKVPPLPSAISLTPRLIQITRFVDLLVGLAVRNQCLEPLSLRWIHCVILLTVRVLHSISRGWHRGLRIIGHLFSSTDALITWGFPPPP